MKRVLLAAALALAAGATGTAGAAVHMRTPAPSPEETSIPEVSPTTPEMSPTSPEMSPSPPEMSPSPGAAVSPSGPGCAAIESDLAEIADQPAGTAISKLTELSMVSAAVKAAGLEEKLNSAKDITLFAPDNKAFDAIPKEVRDKLMANKDVLTKLLSYHVVTGKKAPSDLVEGADLKTMQGASLTVKGSGDNLTINDAKIVCGGVTTSNATVYIVDKVLMPH
ncbi:fasciclin domain-containing protein [Nonomuraea sp. NPDC050153]|uniref:fasciclin domain-containing protein n=1 Tax=Nonomuraea sp. NPDC050153 TaxID=3364359 RepID=UPI0037902A61